MPLDTVSSMQKFKVVGHTILEIQICKQKNGGSGGLKKYFRLMFNMFRLTLCPQTMP